MAMRCTGEKRWGRVKAVLILTVGSGIEWLGLINGGGRSQMSWAYWVKYGPLDETDQRLRFNFGVIEIKYEARVGRRMGDCGPLICRYQWWIFTE